MERRKGVVRARIESERVVTPEQFEDVQELYLAALERETASRTHYVRYACGGDDVLAREVLSLLAYHGATGPLDASLSVFDLADRAAMHMRANRARSMNYSDSTGLQPNTTDTRLSTRPLLPSLRNE